ncbi:MAG TPA: hypothetical protein VG675_20590 [Bryobacteraceae bacterium]|nr:hypothetical protein [Bryobacteraceae bacterium]
MRYFAALLLLVSAGFLCAQTPDDPELARAQAGVEKTRTLVDAGVLPRADLDQAEAQLADAQDEAVLRRTLYGSDLTGNEADEMLAAAGRRLDRRKQALAEARRRVDAGVATELSLGTYLEDLDRARKEWDLADTRARLAHDLAEMAEAEEALQTKLAEAPAEAKAVAERYDGNGIFTHQLFEQVEAAFEARFGKPLPVSAMGETAVHRALGFDHRGRVDVALQPDQPEGVWLRQYLAQNHIPYFAFRQAVPGKATGAHIHMGPMSTRLANGG